LTQEKLAQELYYFNKEFIGLNTVTLSRWERNHTQPSIDRQIDIIKYFHSISGHILPCFDKIDKETIENEICKIGIKNLIGTSKEHILNFPAKSFKVDDIHIKQIKDSKNIDETLQMPFTIIENLTGNIYNLSFNDVKEWSIHPSNLFLISEYKNQFAGMFFTLRLKPKIFNQIIDFKTTPDKITINDFATFNEIGCNFPISFFAYNNKSSTLLFLRYYAHLIANQDIIDSVGTTPLLDGAKRIVQKMNMTPHKEKSIKQGVLTSYYAPLKNLLINKATIKILFQKKECSQ
jgi:DNA-binding XRE family transcriptional regulator